MIGIVYATGSLLPRRVVVSDDWAEFKPACALDDGESLIIRDDLKSVSLEALQQIIAEQTGTPVEDHPTGRCAVVLPDTREVIEFIVADPALDAITEEHQLGGDQVCELHATDDAKLGDKITQDGDLLARVVSGDREGVVAAVDWVKPDAIPDGHVEDSFAEPGDVVEALKLTDVPAEGTQKL